MIHLDANLLVSALANGSAAQAKVRAWLTGGETLAISAVAWAEFLCGPLPDPAVNAADLRQIAHRWTPR